MSTRRLLLLTVTAVAVLGGAWGLLSSLGSDGGRYVSEHPVSAPEEARTVTASATMPLPSAHERRLSAMLEEGEMPSGPMLAEVLTDTECAPDEQMISRCRNEMRLADGRTIVLRHPHDMRSVPCLAPGEQVFVVPASA